MNKRAILYARVSGDDRDSDGRNLAGQLEMCRKYAQEHNYAIVAEIAEDDRGASGASFELPGLSRALEMARAGESDVLVTREIDRFARNLAKQLIVEQELQRAGVSIEYVLYDFPDTPEGRLNKNVRAMLAEYEREKIAERTTRARLLKVKDGNVMVHGRSPYGYRLAEVNGKSMLAICEPEAQTVRLIFQWFIEGDGENGPLSTSDITRRLTALKIPTFVDTGVRNRGWAKKRGPGEWSRSSVYKLLRNETYIGIWRYGTTAKSRSAPLIVAVPAIIAPETWAAAQARMVENRQNSHRNRKYDYLLSKRVVCGKCGSRVCGESTNWHGKQYLYYRCPATTRMDYTHTCDMPCFRADQADTAVWDWVKSFLNDPVVLATGLRAEQEVRERDNAPWRDRLVVVDDLLTDNRRQLERLLDLYVSGDFPKEMLTERKTRLEATIGVLERERAGLMAQIEIRVLTDDQIRSIQEFAAGMSAGLEIANADFATRLRLIEMLDVRVTLTVENGVKVAYVQCMLGEDTLPVVPTRSPAGSPRNCPPLGT